MAFMHFYAGSKIIFCPVLSRFKRSRKIALELTIEKRVLFTASTVKIAKYFPTFETFVRFEELIGSIEKH
jgi:hypothetical protein